MTERELSQVKHLCEKAGWNCTYADRKSFTSLHVVAPFGGGNDKDLWIPFDLPTFVEALRVWTEGQGIRMINVCCCPETDFTWACTIEIDGTMIHPDSANYPIEGDGPTPPLAMLMALALATGWKETE